MNNGQNTAKYEIRLLNDCRRLGEIVRCTGKRTSYKIYEELNRNNRRTFNVFN